MRAETPKGEDGFALITVLWAVLILATIAASIIATGRTESRLSRTHLDMAELDAVADAAINITILHLLDPTAEVRPPADGTPFTIEFAGRRVTVTVLDESGKIDLNMADAELLRRLLVAAGVGADAAQPLVDKILDWREPGEGKRLNGAKANEYNAAGILYGPRGAPFESIEELQLVLGITPELYARLAPSLTVYSQTPWVDPTFAPKDVLTALAGMGGDPVSTVLAERGTGSTGGDGRACLHDQRRYRGPRSLACRKDRGDTAERRPGCAGGDLSVALTRAPAPSLPFPLFPSPPEWRRG
jgi:general secretion pathway protein K